MSEIRFEDSNLIDTRDNLINPKAIKKNLINPKATVSEEFSLQMPEGSLFVNESEKPINYTIGSTISEIRNLPSGINEITAKTPNVPPDLINEYIANRGGLKRKTKKNKKTIKRKNKKTIKRRNKRRNKRISKKN